MPAGRSPHPSLGHLRLSQIFPELKHIAQLLFDSSGDRGLIQDHLIFVTKGVFLKPADHHPTTFNPWAAPMFFFISQPLLAALGCPAFNSTLELFESATKCQGHILGPHRNRVVSMCAPFLCQKKVLFAKYVFSKQMIQMFTESEYERT